MLKGNNKYLVIAVVVVVLVVAGVFIWPMLVPAAPAACPTC